MITLRHQPFCIHISLKLQYLFVCFLTNYVFAPWYIIVRHNHCNCQNIKLMHGYLLNKYHVKNAFLHVHIVQCIIKYSINTLIWDRRYVENGCVFVTLAKYFFVTDIVKNLFCHGDATKVVQHHTMDFVYCLGLLQNSQPNAEEVRQGQCLT